MKQALSYLKFFLKIYGISGVRRLLLWLLGSRPNRTGWQHRILLVHFGGIGDIVVATGAIAAIARANPDKKITLATSSGLNASNIGAGVSEVFPIRYGLLSHNPFYGFSVVAALRRIGFYRAINIDMSAAEVLGKMIALEVAAPETCAYEGFGIQVARPFDANMKHNVAYVRQKLFPFYATVVPSRDMYDTINSRLLHVLRHYQTFVFGVTGKDTSEEDLRPRLPEHNRSATGVFDILKQHGIDAGSYCLITLGTSTVHREWPPERFAAVAQAVSEDYDMPVVLVGSKKELPLARRFRESFSGKVLDMCGQTSLEDVIALTRQCRISLSNDTGAVHIAVALKKPSVAILGLGHFGQISLYGYCDINRWVYADRFCLCDNWRCIHEVDPNEPMPCIQAVQPNAVEREVRSALQASENQTGEFHIECPA